MHTCDICGKVFTRKFNLSRHLSSQHRSLSYINGDNASSIKLISHDMDNKTPSTKDDISVSSYDGDAFREIDMVETKNDEENASELLKKINSTVNNVAKDGLSPFEQRIQAATQAIQSKFDSLQRQRNAHKCGNENTNGSNANEQKEILTASENHDGSTFIPKITALLQTALDILLIKELQSTDTEDECEKEEENYNKQRVMKRTITSNSTKENENEELRPKHIKHNNSQAFENDNNINDEESNDVAVKYWHNPNTLVNELRQLVVTTGIGQQIFRVIKDLKNNNNTQYFLNDNIEHEKQRKALIEELKNLKRASVGQKIFSIIYELLNADVIEIPSYLNGLSKYDGAYFN